MTKLKKLKEQRAELIATMEAALEKREMETFDATEAKLAEIDAEIRATEKLINLKADNAAADEDDEKRNEDDACEEIRAAIAGTEEFDVTNLEIRQTTLSEISGNTSVGNIKKTTFADHIIQRLPFISPLFGACRKEVLTSATHSIPVQKTKIGKFVRMAELQKYAEQNADYNTVKLEAHKYGTLISFTEEVLADLGYNVEADMLNQLVEAYGLTMDELIVTGDSTNKIEGLNSFVDDAAVHVNDQETNGAITPDELLNIYYSLPVQYRNNATWVISDTTARELSKLKFADGTPVLFAGYGNAPVGQGSSILGKPVIINNFVAPLTETGAASVFFGDLQKALLVGPRRAFTIKRSDEYGWIDDSIFIKANVRLDIKKTLPEAMAILKNA